MEPEDLIGDPDAAIEFGNQILSDLGDLPERAEDFVAGKEPVVSGIVDWVDTNSHVTERQAETLCDIRGKVDRWMERMR